MHAKNLLKPPAIWLLFWLFIYFFILTGTTVLRFSSPMLNYWSFLLLAFAFPFNLIWLGRKWPEFWSWSISVTIVSIIPLVLVSFFTLADIQSLSQHGRDLSYEKMSELGIGNHYYRLYRANGGATTSFRLTLKKETPIFKIFKIVKHIKGFKAYKGRLEKVSPEKINLFYVKAGGEKEQVYAFKT